MYDYLIFPKLQSATTFLEGYKIREVTHFEAAKTFWAKFGHRYTLDEEMALIVINLEESSLFTHKVTPAVPLPPPQPTISQIPIKDL